MRNLLALGGAALLIFLGLGWYLDWYRLKAAPGTDGHRQINIDLNTNKITEDVGKGKEKVVDWLAKDHNTQTVNPGSSSGTPGIPTGFRPENPVPAASGPVLPAPR